MKKIYTFWQTALLGQHTYCGSPFPPQVQLPVTKNTLDAGGLFQFKVDYYPKDNLRPLI